MNFSRNNSGSRSSSQDDADSASKPSVPISSWLLSSLTRRFSSLSVEQVESEPEETTCEHCRAVHQAWDHVSREVNRKGSDYFYRIDRNAIHIAELEHLTDDSSECPTCRFFWSMRWRVDHQGHWSLYGFSPSKLFGRRHGYTQMTLLLGVVPSTPKTETIISHGEALTHSKGIGFIAPVTSVPTLPLTSQPASISGRKIETGRIDFSLLRHWFSNQSGAVDRRRSEGLSRPVPIHLIDVYTRRIEPAPAWRSEFAALSYVWGNVGGTTGDAQGQHVQGRLPDRCAQTIEDAIIVTKGLHLRYLWVDYYCISKDPKIRHSQIARMDVVYKSAYVTIVAAAGEDASYGLPGISRPRLPQLSCQVDEDEFVSVHVGPLRDLDLSKYSTRGWTYQEKFFSARCLVFTDHQVFMDSPEKNHIETLVSPAATVRRTNDGLRYQESQDHDLELEVRVFERERGFDMAGSCKTVWHHLRERYTPSRLRVFQKHLELYTQRNLSYDSDSLNAISAVLERFEIGSHPIRSFYGVPYGFSTNGQWTQTFSVGLSWIHTDLDKLPERRREFPSWSWAGWKGEICWLETEYMPVAYSYQWPSYHPSDFEHPWDNNGLRSKCHCESENTTTIEIWQDMYLRVKAQTMRVDFDEMATERKGHTGLFLRVGSFGAPQMFKARLHLAQWNLPSELRNRSTGRLLAIKLAEKEHRSVGGGVSEAHLLVVTEPRTERDSCERVGVMKVPLEWYVKQGKEMRELILA